MTRVIAGFTLLTVFAPLTALAKPNQFGFLVGADTDEFEFIEAVDARWARPHPGPFVWDNMQSSRNADITFESTDRYVRAAQKQQVHILATLWPYAEWDQSDQANCFHSDEFSQTLGEYRCNPQHWAAYRRWVKAVVERYDGDGQDDMSGLKMPIRNWEINNEPDLRPVEADGLQFYMEGPNSYAKLLRLTAKAIRTTDPKARVVLAGAAGGDDQFLDFYRALFRETNAEDFFDIANIHCISSGDIDTFNVAAYQAMLAEFNITQPIWVTEAESFVSEDPDLNAAQLRYSVQQVLNLGVKKIFFTSTNFSTPPGGGGMGQTGSVTEADPDLDGNNPKAAYKQIIE